MAATGRSERSSRSTAEQQRRVDFSGSVRPEGTPREGFSSPLNLLELPSIVQIDANVIRSEAGTICLGNPDRGLYPVEFKDDESDVSSVYSSKSEESCGSQGPASPSQVFDFTPKSGGDVLSPTQSPPLQTMDRVGGNEPYDPFRIPSAVFQTSRSISQLEWSIGSNESLFSINVGNNSFSRDHMLMLSDSQKSSELTKSGELFVFKPPPVVTTSRETEVASVELEEEPTTADTTEYDIKDKGSSVAEDLSVRSEPTPAVSWNSSSKSCRSGGSQSSSNSFAFPILADEEVQGGSVAVDAKKKHQNTQSTAVSLKSTAKSQLPCCSFSVHVLVANGVSVHVLVANGVAVHLLVANGVALHLLVANGVALHLLVANGASLHLLVANGVALHLLVANGVALHLLVANGAALHLLVANGVALHVHVANGIAVHVLLVANGIAVHVLLVANGVFGHVLAADGTVVHVLVSHAAALVVVFVVVVIFVDVVIFFDVVVFMVAVIIILLIIFVVVVEKTLSLNLPLT
ncbi:hypothetical protein SDJN02_25856, partial [Cucurbita argyrosperma subsp. argyrosperma]